MHSVWTKLKPCPLCGKDRSNLVIQDGRNWVRIMCVDCSLDLEYYQQNDNETPEMLWKECIKRWNTRK